MKELLFVLDQAYLKRVKVAIQRIFILIMIYCHCWAARIIGIHLTPTIYK